ncbi:unnamed protein product [Darwinula stevensoni]|uniref:AH domain-containing protein n=1 Tax=Darwinula stevensoni TaxID=69355 RepID=A0A7R9A8Z0_9CRUS|nr:unnamed protein product [Darwinula stevensoni]CAG0896872.1 unnamed protein product [Darwinula stevensoni]
MSEHSRMKSTTESRSVLDSLDGSSATFSKFQQQYWLTKEVVSRKLKKDDDVTATDTELDTKLELYKSIKDSSEKLHKSTSAYGKRISKMASEMNCFGDFLKENSKSDKTKAGVMMLAVGKCMGYSAQLALMIRIPMGRLEQEVETFRQRAISDTDRTVSETEKSRHEYRATLMWMKEASQTLDPDAHKQMDKFRKVQREVRKSKTKFDRLKLDCMQKVDLLAASRCNMFSYALQKYQEQLLNFWEKSNLMVGKLKKFFDSRYVPYDFLVVKELQSASKALEEHAPSVEDLFSTGDPDLKLFFEEFHDILVLDKEGKEGDREKRHKKKGQRRSKNKTEEEKPEEHNGVGADSDEKILDLADGTLPLQPPEGEKEENEATASSLIDEDFRKVWEEAFGGVELSVSTAESKSMDTAQALQELFGVCSTPESEPPCLVPPSNSSNPSMNVFDNLLLPSQLLDVGQPSDFMNMSSFPLPSGNQNQVVDQKSNIITGSTEASVPNSSSNTSLPTSQPDYFKSWYSKFAHLDPLADPDAFKTEGNEDV